MPVVMIRLIKLALLIIKRYLVPYFKIHAGPGKPKETDSKATTLECAPQISDNKLYYNMFKTATVEQPLLSN